MRLKALPGHNSFSMVTGRSRTRLPVARYTALAIAGATDTAVFDDKILAFGESELAQFGKEDLITWPRDRIVEDWTQNTDTSNSARLLRARRERPSYGRAAECG